MRIYQVWMLGRPIHDYPLSWAQALESYQWYKKLGYDVKLIDTTTT